MSEHVGLYGGSFDPIHYGHLISARSVAEQVGLTRVILIPSARPPHKRDLQMTDARHRLAMSRLAVEGDALFEVSDAELNRQGPSYTFDTVCHFRNELGRSTELYWIIGADSLPELPTWYRIADLVATVRIITMRRPGWEAPDASVLAAAVGADGAAALLGQCYETPRIDISSTEIRARVACGRSIRYLTPAVVASYISQQGLYRPGGGLSSVE